MQNEQEGKSQLHFSIPVLQLGYSARVVCCECIDQTLHRLNKFMVLHVERNIDSRRKFLSNSNSFSVYIVSALIAFVFVVNLIVQLSFFFSAEMFHLAVNIIIANSPHPSDNTSSSIHRQAFQDSCLF